MIHYQVGECRPEFRGTDGVFLSIDEGGLFLVCRMAAPTEEEKRAFRASEPVRIGMGHFAGVLFWTVQFGEIPMMDCFWAPPAPAQTATLPPLAPGMGYALTVLLADGETGEILSLRLLGLPHDFSMALAVIYSDLRFIGRERYAQAMAFLYRNSTQQLDDMATVRCLIAGKGGEG